MRRILSLLFIIALSVDFLQGQHKNPLLVNDSLQQKRWVDSVFNSLTLKERIGQLFMVAAYSNRDERHVSEIAQLVAKQGIGGIIFFQGGPARQANQTNYYQSIARVPLLIGMDAEWGLGMRLDSTISYPRQMAFGSAGDTLLMYRMASDLALQLKRLGVHVNFAPVVDVNSNPLNPVIGSRAFGEDREVVARFGLSYMRGLQDNGIIACAKHFPGHGDTNDDSHLTLPTIPHSSNVIDSLHIYSFSRLIAKGVASVMVGHLRVPAFEPDSLIPSSLSNRIIGQKLMGGLGFSGLIFTDAMNMKAVSALYDPVEANIRALLAGNDVLLFPSEIEKTISRIEVLIRKGQFPEEIINIKCRKILMSKYFAGLNSYKPIELKNLYSDLNQRNYQLLRRQIAARAITLIHNDSILPLKRLDTLRIAYIEIGANKGDVFREQLELYSDVHTFSIEVDVPQDEYDTLLALLEPYNLIIAGLHTIDSRAAMGYGVSQQASNFLFDLSFQKKVILTLFGNPYAVTRFSNPFGYAGILVSYDNSPDAQGLTAQAIFGGRPISGRLTVNASVVFSVNTGQLIAKPIRLSYAIPEEIGINSADLAEVDSIALEAIKAGATPGMQIIAAKNGVVFYHKSFGKPTYVSEFDSDTRMLYDVASVTKVAATLPAVMQLYDSKRIDLNANLGSYINLIGFPDKSSIKLIDILRHQSGLLAWLPFYTNTLKSIEPSIPLWSQTLSLQHPFKVNGNRYVSRYSYPSPTFYRTDSSSLFPVRVAFRLFAIKSMPDSIFRWMNVSPLSEPGKYRYSDLNFLYLQRVVETLEGKRLDKIIAPLYRQMGMNYTTYNPTERFETDRIIPTELDPVFRKQLLWGHVHDPAAAMIGGVAGHAGLFANANDMVKLMQLYLNDGEYGGERYFAPGTVILFSNPNVTNGNRRAYGFDKPALNGSSSPAGSLASPQSFGHTGFTGTVVWADPQNGLIYVFLSNRVHPNAENNKLVTSNIRTRIHDVFYRAIGLKGSK